MMKRLPRPKVKVEPNAVEVIDVTCRHISSRQLRSPRRPRYQRRKENPHLLLDKNIVGYFRVMFRTQLKLTVGSIQLVTPRPSNGDLMVVADNTTIESTVLGWMFSLPLRMCRGKNWLLPLVNVHEDPRLMLAVIHGSHQQPHLEPLRHRHLLVDLQLK